MKKVIGIILLVLLLCLVAVGCKEELLPDKDNEDPIDIPIEAYDYFYQSLVLALQADNAQLSISTEFNSQPELDPIVIIKKTNGVILYERDQIKRVYSNGKAYYGDNYSLYAEMPLKQFLGIVFNEVYEVEIDYFMFSDDFDRKESGLGYKLTATTEGFPHNYSIELITDGNHAFQSAHFVSETMWFTRDIDLTINNNQPTGVPDAESLPATGIDRKDTFDNLAEISTYLYMLTQIPDIKKTVSYAEGSEIVYQLDETYRVKGARARLDYDNGYDYYENGRFYMYVSDLTPEFNKRTYAEISISNFRIMIFRDFFWRLNISEDNLTIVKTVDNNIKTFTSDEFYLVVKDNVLEYVVFKEYHEYESKWHYEKHQFILEVEDISPPSGFQSADFISYYKADELQTAASGLVACKTVMDNKFTYDGTNPQPSEYLNALNSPFVNIVDAPPTSPSMTLRTFYVHEIPTVDVTKGEIVAIYYKGTTGAYKVYYNDNQELVYDEI